MRRKYSQAGRLFVLYGNRQPRTLPRANPRYDVQQELMGQLAMASSLRLRSSSTHRDRDVDFSLMERKRSSLSLVFHVEESASDPKYRRLAPQSEVFKQRAQHKNVKVPTCRGPKAAVATEGKVIGSSWSRRLRAWHRLDAAILGFFSKVM
jgi:hypothetical protein